MRPASCSAEAELVEASAGFLPVQANTFPLIDFGPECRQIRFSTFLPRFQGNAFPQWRRHARWGQDLRLQMALFAIDWCVVIHGALHDRLE